MPKNIDHKCDYSNQTKCHEDTLSHFLFSPLPYNMEIATPLPIQSPKSIDVKNVISV